MAATGFDKWAPKLKDKASVLGSSFNDLEKAVIKATRSNTKPPKEKHVRALILQTETHGTRVTEIIHLLAKRLEAPEWMIVLKALIVFHRLLRDGKSMFINELKYKSQIFAQLAKYSDQITAESHHQSVFVRKYSRYLEEKVVVYKIAKIEFEKDPAAVKKFEVDELLDKTPRLQSLLNALLNTKASKDHINNQIIVSAFQLLLKDSFRLYRALNEAIILLLEHYFSMGQDDATKALEIYKLFVRETESTITFFDMCERFARTQLPEIQHAPTTLVDALENYLKDLAAGKSVSEAGGGRGAAAAKEAVTGKDARVEQAKQDARAQKALDLLDVSSEEDEDDGSDSDQDEELTGATKRNPFDPFATDARTTGASSSQGGPNVDPFDDDSKDALPTFSALSADPFGPSLAESGGFSSEKADIMSLFDTPSASAGFGGNTGGFGANSSTGGFGGNTGGFGGNTGGFGGNTGGFGGNAGGFGGANAGFGATGGFGGNTGGASGGGGFGVGTGFGATAPSAGSDSPFDDLVDFGKPKPAPKRVNNTPIGAMTGGSTAQNTSSSRGGGFGASPSSADNPFGQSSNNGATFNPFG